MLQLPMKINLSQKSEISYTINNLKKLDIVYSKYIRTGGEPIVNALLLFTFILVRIYLHVH